jgi:hypothetical protein
VHPNCWCADRRRIAIDELLPPLDRRLQVLGLSVSADRGGILRTPSCSASGALSIDPMSQRVPCGRGTPRWSKGFQVLQTSPPASITDNDRDGAGEACDCAPTNPLDLPPPPIGNLALRRVAPDGIELDWSVASGVESYRLTQGALAGLAASDYGSCAGGPIDAPPFVLSDGVPLPGAAHTYLVQGYDSSCGGGSLGFTSEAARVNLNPDACP